MQRIVSFCLLTLTIGFIGRLFLQASSFFIPVVCALSIAYLMIAMTEGVSKLHINGRSPPFWLALIVVILAFLAALHFLINLVGANVYSLAEAMPSYQEKLIYKARIIREAFGIPDTMIRTQVFEKVNLVSVTAYLLLLIRDLASSAGMISIYVIFILMEYSFFQSKVNALVPEAGRRKETVDLLTKVVARINSYLRLKTLISVLTAGISYGILTVIGVDFAAFSAFLVFCLNFIPTVGSIIATVFPCMIAFVQFDTLTPLFILAAGLVLTQFGVGNVLEPRLMGRSFNLSGLVIILSLSIWGYIWGIVGMLLCVPILVIISIILANFPQTRWIAILISQDGNVD